MSKLKPINGNVILRPVEEQEMMSGNIIIPDMGKEKPEMGEIVAISQIYNFNKGEYIPTVLEVGMKVLIPKLGAQSVTVEGEEFYITAQSSILSILED
jgi:chaperonin GroES